MLDDAARAGPRLLEVRHVAHRLSASDGYVRQLIRTNKLTAIRIGTRWRIDPTDLQAYLDAQRRVVRNEEPPDNCGGRLHALPMPKGA